MRQTVIHSAPEVISDLSRLAVGNQCAYSYETSVSQREGRTQPEIAEEKISRVLHQARRDSAEVAFYLRSPLLLGFLIQGQQLLLRRRKLVQADAALMEDVLRDRNTGHGICPSGIEGEMRDDLR